MPASCYRTCLKGSFRDLSIADSGRIDSRHAPPERLYQPRPRKLSLPAQPSLGAADHTRQVSLNEMDSATVQVTVDADGNVVFNPDHPEAEPFGPTMALLGTVDPLTGLGVPMMWADPVTENPALGATEIWEISNFTMDAHPIHVHQVQFQVVSREAANGVLRPPEAWEGGFKDTVIAYPGEVTRIKAKFDLPGRYVWHCHILSHEDNEMMRPFHVGPLPVPQTAGK